MIKNSKEIVDELFFIQNNEDLMQLESLNLDVFKKMLLNDRITPCAVMDMDDYLFMEFVDDYLAKIDFNKDELLLLDNNSLINFIKRYVENDYFNFYKGNEYLLIEIELAKVIDRIEKQSPEEFIDYYFNDYSSCINYVSFDNILKLCDKLRSLFLNDKKAINNYAEMNYYEAIKNKFINEHRKENKNEKIVVDGKEIKIKRAYYYDYGYDINNFLKDLNCIYEDYKGKA